MITFIVGGGSLNSDFLRRQLDAVSNFDYKVIACDGGLKICLECNITPDYIIGDFDSAGEGLYERACELNIPLQRLNPIKDDTDAEACLQLAINRYEGDIIILGGTGTRLDHVLGNISILGIALKNNRRAFLVDEKNRIQMIGPGHSVTIPKQTQYGKYISVFPYMSESAVIDMEGVKYPLKNYEANGFTSLTVSNEIIDETATISVRNGYLIVMETCD